MSDSDKKRLQRASQLIRTRQYDRARIILQQMPDNPKAQEWLDKLDELDPAPLSFEEAQEELDEARHELEEAEEEIELTKEVAQRSFSLSLALLIFLGSLIGSLLGAAADFGEAIDTIDQIKEYFHPELCILGSDTILGDELGMANEWADNFDDDREVQIKIDAIGSTNGVRRAADGDCAHVLAMSEPMTDDHYQRLDEAGVEIECAAEIGYDIIVFITDITNPVPVVEDRILRSMLLGNELSWGALTNRFEYPVTIMVRQGSGTTEFVMSNIGRWDSEGGNKFPSDANYVFCDSNDDCLDRTLSMRGSLYWVSAAWMSTQPPEFLRVLPVLSGDESSVNPLRESVDLEMYPKDLQRPLYMYVLRTEDTDEEELQLARDFLLYVRGVQGQQTLTRHYFYPHFAQPTDIEVPLPEGFDPVGTPNRRLCR